MRRLASGTTGAWAWPALVVVAALGLPALTLLLTTGGRAPTQQEAVWTDVAWYFTPVFAVLRRSLAEGTFPLWNPHQLAGWPFLAAFQTQALYLPAWMLAWLEPVWAATAYGAAHWSFALLGAAAFARSIGMGWAASLATALCYCLSHGVSNSFFMHSAGLAVQSWLPWCALAVTRAARGTRPSRDIPLLSLALAMAILAGAPEHMLYLMLCVGVVAAWQGWEHGGAAGSARALGLLAAGAAGAALLCAAQILPTLELMQHAIRALGTFEMEYAGRYSMDAAELLRSVALGAHGPVRVTVLLLPLAALALVSPQTRRRAAVPVLMCVLILDFLRGTSGFTFPIYFQLPVVGSFRTHLRIHFVYAFFAAVAAGFGVQALAGWLQAHRRAAVASATVILTVLTGDLVSRAVVDRVYVPLAAPRLVQGRTDLPAAIAAVRAPERVFVDYSTPIDGLQHKLGDLHGIHHVAEYDALVPARYARFFGVPDRTPWMGRLQFQSRDKVVGNRTETVPGVELASLDLLSTRFYLARTGKREELLRLRTGGQVRLTNDYTVTERVQARPRAYIVHRFVAAGGDEEALAALRAPTFDPAGSVVLTSATPAVEEAPPGAAERVAVTVDEPNRVRIEAECASRCLLVLTDLHFPGWKAFDGESETDILVANYMLRAVALSPGEHVVEFRYRPVSFVTGAAVSGLSLLIVSALLFRGRANHSS